MDNIIYASDMDRTLIFSNHFIKADVREFGSGNAGTTNVMRVGGFLPGALTFLCDALKGFIACFAGKLVFEKVFENAGVALSALCGPAGAAAGAPSGGAAALPAEIQRPCGAVRCRV